MASGRGRGNTLPAWMTSGANAAAPDAIAAMLGDAASSAAARERQQPWDGGRRDRSRSRERSRRDEPRRDAAPVKQEGESLLAGRDIMGDVIAAERAEATVDHKGDCYRRPIGFNTALIVASDKYTYKARARSRSPDRVKEVVHVAPVVPSRRDD